MAAATSVPLDVVFVVVFSEAMKPDSIALSLSPPASLDSPRFDDDQSTLIISTSAPSRPAPSTTRPSQAPTTPAMRSRG